MLCKNIEHYISEYKLFFIQRNDKRLYRACMVNKRLEDMYGKVI